MQLCVNSIFLWTREAHTPSSLCIALWGLMSVCHLQESRGWNDSRSDNAYDMQPLKGTGQLSSPCPVGCEEGAFVRCWRQRLERPHRAGQRLFLSQSTFEHHMQASCGLSWAAETRWARVV